MQSMERIVLMVDDALYKSALLLLVVVVVEKELFDLLS